MRILIRLAATAFVLVLALLIAAAALFTHAMLQPWPRTTPPPPDARTVTIPAADDVTLSAWWRGPAAANNGNCVVILHGIGDSRAGANGFASIFLDEGYAVLLPDSRAHGASGGRYVTYGLLEKDDTIRWAEWLRRAGCNKLYALGESLGASVLIQSTGIKPMFSAIVAESPFADLREVGEYRLHSLFNVPKPLVPLLLQSSFTYASLIDHLNLRHVSPIESIANETTPILLIHGLADERTPAYNSERVSQANPRNHLWLVPNAGHTAAFATAPEEFRQRVLTWFATH